MLIHNKEPHPFFIPRFDLSNMSIVGVELIIRKGRKELSAAETICGDMKHDGIIKSICLDFNKINDEKGIKPLYLSIKFPLILLNAVAFNAIIKNILTYFEDIKIEIILDCDLCSYNKQEVISKIENVFIMLPSHFRKCISYKNPLDFNMKDILKIKCDCFILKKDFLFRLTDNYRLANDGRHLIDLLNENNIDTVIDSIYSRHDLSTAVMFGVKFGQGFYLSREYSNNNVNNIKNILDNLII